MRSKECGTAECGNFSARFLPFAHRASRKDSNPFPRFGKTSCGRPKYPTVFLQYNATMRYLRLPRERFALLLQSP